MIGFNVPPCTGNEMKYIEEAVRSHRICGDGPFTARCSAWLEERFHAHRALLTTSMPPSPQLMFLVSWNENAARCPMLPRGRPL